MQRVICLLVLSISSLCYGFMELWDDQIWHNLEGNGRGITRYHNAPHKETWSPYTINLNRNNDFVPIYGRFIYSRSEMQFIGIFEKWIDLNAAGTDTFYWEADWRISYTLTKTVLIESFYRNETNPDWTETMPAYIVNPGPQYPDFYTAGFSGNGSFNDSSYHDWKIVMTVVPEPSSVLLLLAGGMWLRRRCAINPY